MSEMARRVSGKGSASIDLSTLDDTDFIDCNFLAFQIKATCLYDLVDINPNAMSEDYIIRTLKTKFWYLKAQVLCSPYEGNNLNMEGDLFGLNQSMNKLVESYKSGRNGRS